MKVILEISEKVYSIVFDRMVKDMDGPTSPGFYGREYKRIFEPSKAYYFDFRTILFTNCANDTWGVYGGDDVYFAIFDGCRSTLRNFLYLLGYHYEHLPVVLYETTDPRMHWWENQQEFLLRMGKDFVLDYIPIYKGDYTREDIENEFHELPGSLQLVVLKLYEERWSDAIKGGRKKQ